MGKSELATSTVAEQSAEALRSLKDYLRGQPPPFSHAQLRLLSVPNGQDPQISVPVEAVALFAEVLEQLAQGHVVKVASESPELLRRRRIAAELTAESQEMGLYD